MRFKSVRGIQALIFSIGLFIVGILSNGFNRLFALIYSVFFIIFSLTELKKNKKEIKNE